MVHLADGGINTRRRVVDARETARNEDKSSKGLADARYPERGDKQKSKTLKNVIV
jgi:hypothetical protein